VELGVLGLVDDTHPTATQLFKDAIVRDGLADHQERDLAEVSIVGQSLDPAASHDPAGVQKSTFSDDR
jgi:hypothetical protein